MDEKKDFKKAKNMFDALKVDPSSVLFSEEILDKKLLNKLKKSKYETDKLFYKLVNLIDSKNVFDDGREHPLELIMSRKEKLIVLLSIVLMALFKSYILT